VGGPLCVGLSCSIQIGEYRGGGHLVYVRKVCEVITVRYVGLFYSEQKTKQTGSIKDSVGKKTSVM